MAPRLSEFRFKTLLCDLARTASPGTPLASVLPGCLLPRRFAAASSRTDAELGTTRVGESLTLALFAAQAAIDKKLIRDGAFARLFVVIFGT